MDRSDEKLSVIFNRTAGKCHICHRKLAFANYGRKDSRGAWEIDHSKAKARGGSNHGNNLFAAHISCNRSKQAVSARVARRDAGFRRPPLSEEQRGKVKFRAVLGAAGVGAVLGAKLAGLPGFWVGGLIGALFGDDHDPDAAASL